MFIQRLTLWDKVYFLPLLQKLQSKCYLCQHIWYNVYVCVRLFSYEFPVTRGRFTIGQQRTFCSEDLWPVTCKPNHGQIHSFSGLVSASVPKVGANVAVMSKYYSLPTRIHCSNQLVEYHQSSKPIAKKPMPRVQRNWITNKYKVHAFSEALFVTL